MMTAFLQFVSICVASWMVWAFIRLFTVKSSLDNIPGPPSQSFFMGNFGQLMDKNGWAFHHHIADTYGSVVKINGMFGEKQLFVFDPKALYHIVVKDQYIYEETSVFVTFVQLILGPGLFGTLGDHHRKQRKMLNPAFSSNHMRHMLPTFYNVVGKLRDAVESEVASGTAEVDMLQWMTRTAMELIGQSGLGCSFDPLTEDAINPYVKAIKNMTPTLYKVAVAHQFLPFIVKIGTPRFRQFVMDLLPWKALHEVRDTTNMLHRMACEVLETKRSALRRGGDAVLEQIGQGKDIMSILLKTNMEASEEDRLMEEELLGQVSTFIFAAVDTSSSAMARILHVLAEHPKEQEKLRREVLDARHRGDLSHDELVALPYLDAVCRETLRLFAPVPALFRTTRKDVILPLSKPIRGVDGKEISEIPIPNNTNVIIGIMASNRDPELWGEDVLEWKPERWLSPLPDNVAAAHLPGVYSHMMTFFGGGRACIGFTFALLEMKVVLSLLLASFSFSPSDKDITWNMSSPTWPGVRGSDTGQLPLKVSKIA